MKKKFLAGILAGAMAFCSFANFEVEAATRAEIDAIQVKKSGNFKYWEKDAVAINALKDYIKDVTNKNSKNFIPVEDRIAVFDMDGTFLCETAPYYFDHMLYLHRALYDPNVNLPAEEKEFAKKLEEAIRNKIGMNLEETASHQASAFSGMKLQDHDNYVRDFIKTPVEGLSNLKWGEALYLPMVEVIKYLQANDFEVYVVSGTDCAVTRVLVCDLMEIPTSNIIGTETEIKSNNQGGKANLDYVFKKGDYLIRGELLTKDLQMNKVIMIAREIGKQPVLAFGNSSSDASMLNVTINDNIHKALAFFVICDDTEREFGKPKRAASDTKLAEENGWITISMRDDWKTIYGDNVKRRN